MLKLINKIKEYGYFIRGLFVSGDRLNDQFQGAQCIEYIDTQVGNTIINTLRAEGWLLIAEYSSLAFDKGIDHDSYTLKKDATILYFEWSNWFEWTIKGEANVLRLLTTRFDLKSV